MYAGDLVSLRNDEWVSLESDTTGSDQLYASLVKKNTSFPRRATKVISALVGAGTIGTSTNLRLNGMCKVVVNGNPSFVVVTEDSSDSGRGRAVWGSFSDGTNYGSVADDTRTWHNGTAWQNSAWSGYQYFHNEGTGEDVEYVDCVSLGAPGAETNKFLVAYSVEGVADDIHLKVCTITAAPTTWLSCGAEYQIDNGTLAQEKEPMHLGTVGTDEVFAIPYRADSEVFVGLVKVTTAGAISKYLQQCQDGAASSCLPNLHLFESTNACGNSSIPWYIFGVINTPDCQYTTTALQGSQSLQLDVGPSTDALIQLTQDIDLWNDDFAVHAKARVITMPGAAFASGPSVWEVSQNRDLDDDFGRFGVSIPSNSKFRFHCGGGVFEESTVTLSTGVTYEIVAKHRSGNLTNEWWVDGTKQTDCVSTEPWVDGWVTTLGIGTPNLDILRVDAVADVDPANDTIDLPNYAFGICLGPFYTTPAVGGTIPPGLAIFTPYWTKEESTDSDTLKLYPTSSCTTPVNITADGVGTLNFSEVVNASGSYIVDEILVTGNGEEPDATEWSEELTRGFRAFPPSLWDTSPATQEAGWCSRSGKGFVVAARVDQASNDDLFVRAWPWRQDYLRAPATLTVQDDDATGIGDIHCTMPTDQDLILQHRGNWSGSGPGLVRHCKVDWDTPSITCQEPQVVVHGSNFGGTTDSYERDRPSSILYDQADSGVIDILSAFYDRGTNPSREATLLRFVDTAPSGERIFLAGAEHGPVDGGILYMPQDAPSAGPGPTVIDDNALLDGARSGATSDFHYMFETDGSTVLENRHCVELPPGKDYTITAEIGLIGTCATGGGDCDSDGDCTGSGNFCDTTTDDERSILGFYGAGGEELCELLIPAGSAGGAETHFSGRRKECSSNAGNPGTPCDVDEHCEAEPGNIAFCQDATYSSTTLGVGYHPITVPYNTVALTYDATTNPFGVKCITSHDGSVLGGTEIPQGECAGGDDAGDACSSDTDCGGGGTCGANAVSEVVDATHACFGLGNESSQPKKLAFDSVAIGFDMPPDWHIRIWDGHPNSEITADGSLNGCSTPNGDDCVDDAVGGAAHDGTSTFWNSTSADTVLKVGLTDHSGLGADETIGDASAWFSVAMIDNLTATRVRTQVFADEFFGLATNYTLFGEDVWYAGIGGIVTKWTDGLSPADADLDAATLSTFNSSASAVDLTQKHVEQEIVIDIPVGHTTLSDVNGDGIHRAAWSGDSRTDAPEFGQLLGTKMIQLGVTTGLMRCATGGSASHHWYEKTCGNGSNNLTCSVDADCLCTDAFDTPATTTPQTSGSADGLCDDTLFAVPGPATGGPTPPLCRTNWQRCLDGYGGTFWGARDDAFGTALGRPDHMIVQLDWLNSTISTDNGWDSNYGTTLQDINGDGTPDGATGERCIPTRGRSSTIHSVFGDWGGYPQGAGPFRGERYCAFGSDAGDLTPMAALIQATPTVEPSCSDYADWKCAFGPQQGNQALRSVGGSPCAGTVACGNVCYDDDTITCTVSGDDGECSGTASKKCVIVPDLDLSCTGQPTIEPTDGVALKTAGGNQNVYLWSDQDGGACGHYNESGSDVDVWTQACTPLASGDGLCCRDTSNIYLIERSREALQEIIDRNLSTNTPAGCADPTCDNMSTALLIGNEGYGGNGTNELGGDDTLSGCWGRAFDEDGVLRAWAHNIRTSDWALDLISPNCEGTDDACWNIGSDGPGNGCASGVECLRNTVPPALIDTFRHMYLMGNRGRPETLLPDGVHPADAIKSPLLNIPATKSGTAVLSDQFTLGCWTPQTGDTTDYSVDGTCENAFVTAE